MPEGTCINSLGEGQGLNVWCFGTQWGSDLIGSDGGREFAQIAQRAVSILHYYV
jgi:hypothetical protein